AVSSSSGSLRGESAPGIRGAARSGFASSSSSRLGSDDSGFDSSGLRSPGFGSAAFGSAGFGSAGFGFAPGLLPASAASAAIRSLSRRDRSTSADAISSRVGTRHHIGLFQRFTYA